MSTTAPVAPTSVDAASAGTAASVDAARTGTTVDAARTAASTGPAPADRAAPLDALLPVVGADLTVPLLDGRTARYVNLDYAATAPALGVVAERVTRLLPYAGSVHRGAGLPSQASSAAYEAARTTVHGAVGARRDDLVVFTRNTTDATNLLARAIPQHAGDVITLDVEHHATLLPWKAAAGHRCVAHDTTVAGTLARLKAALAERPAALLAITAASNVTGEVLPLRTIVELAHAHGARVLLDAAQLAPHRRIDLTALGADYLAFSGHKLYAPYGAGVLVGRRDWLDAAPPYLAGGGAVREVTVEHTEWATGPARHEAGTPNLVGAVAIATALRALGELAGPDGEDPRAAHEAALRDHVLAGIADLPGVEALSIWEDAPDAIGVVAFTVDGYAPGHVGAYLSAEHGIGVRDGRFCAHPLLARLGRPEGALRASFGVGSRQEDAERLVAALEQLVTDGPRHRYCQGPTGWAPEHDTRDVGAWLGDEVDAAAPAVAAPCGT